RRFRASRAGGGRARACPRARPPEARAPRFASARRYSCAFEQHVIRRQLGRRAAPEKREGILELESQDVEDAADALFPVERESVENWPSDERRIRAQSKSGSDIGPASDPAVDVDLGPTADRLDDLRQGL